MVKFIKNIALKIIKENPLMMSNDKLLQANSEYLSDTCDPLITAAKNGACVHKNLCHYPYSGKQMPKSVLPEVLSIGFWDAAKNQNWGLDKHRNQGIEITYLEKGRLNFEVDQNEYELKPGDLTVTRPWQLHQVGRPHVMASRLHYLILDVQVTKSSDPWVWPSWLILPPADLKKLAAYLSQNKKHVWNNAQHAGESFLRFTDFLNTIDKEAKVPETRLKLHINELLISMFEMLEEKSSQYTSPSSIASRAVEIFINDLPDNIHILWTLESMAEYCNLGRSQFSYYFKQITNQTPMKFLTECKIAIAKEKLSQNSKQSMAEIARDCGFASAQYFSTVFFQKTQMSPLQYRKTHTIRQKN